jgi:hypothetical protein
MKAKFIEILREYKDRIIIEVGAHDHTSSLRYHSSRNVLDFPDPSTHFFFKNLLVAPAIDPNKKNNPGISMFKVDDSGVPHNLKYEFLNLNPTYGLTDIPKKLSFYSLDFASKYQLTNLDAQSLADFA